MPAAPGLRNEGDTHDAVRGEANGTVEAVSGAVVDVEATSVATVPSELERAPTRLPARSASAPVTANGTRTVVASPAKSDMNGTDANGAALCRTRLGISSSLDTGSLDTLCSIDSSGSLGSIRALDTLGSIGLLGGDGTTEEHSSHECIKLAACGTGIRSLSSGAPKTAACGTSVCADSSNTLKPAACGTSVRSIGSDAPKSAACVVNACGEEAQ